MNCTIEKVRKAQQLVSREQDRASRLTGAERAAALSYCLTLTAVIDRRLRWLERQYYSRLPTADCFRQLMENESQISGTLPRE